MAQVSTAQFLSALYPEVNGHYLELRKLPNVEQIWCRSIGEALTAASDSTRNIFFSVCLRSEKKGDEDHAVLLPALWADVDLKHFGGDKQQAAERIRSFPRQPSIIVRTGGGSHLYWLLKEPEEIALKNRPYLRGLLLGIAGALGGDPACRDLARVMRVPGTWHLKRDGKLVRRENCPSPVLCQIISWHPERRYNPCDFDTWYVEDKDSGTGGTVVKLDQIPAELPKKFIRALETDTELQAAWEGKRQPPNDQSRSGHDAMLAAMLANRGFEPEDSAAILRQYPHGKGMEGSMSYLSRTVAHARALVEESGERRERAPQEPATPAATATRVHLTDVGNGQRLAARHGQDLRYDHTAKRWYAWDGKRWSPDARGQVETWAKDTAKSIYIMAGSDGLIAFLRRAVGASLAGVQRDHILLLLYSAGANGKSTFVETFLALFGDYGHQASTSTFLEQRIEGIRTDIADLRGARFVSAVETKQGRRLDEALVKALTGGDTVRARHLYQEAFSLKPQFTCWLATNHKPEIREQTLAIWRRIRLVPFDVSIPPEKQDRDLAAKLREELPGIFTWALKGCLEWQAEGLGTAEEIDRATGEYRQEQDILADFLAESCTVRSDGQIMASELYRAYVAWCQAQGEGEVKQRTFGKMLSERGFRRRRGAGGKHFYQGLALSPSDPSDQVTQFRETFPMAIRGRTFRKKGHFRHFRH